MSLFILLYIVIILGIFSLVFILYKKYIHLIYGKYLLFGLTTFCLWLILYLLAFTTTLDPEVLLYLSRSLYALSCIAIYSMTLFFLSFGYLPHKRKKFQKIQKYFLFGALVLLFFSIFSPFFIKGMLLLEGTQGIYYEDFGLGFFVLEFLYLLNPVVTISIIFYKVKKLNGINKLRYKYLSLGYIIFLLLFVLFLAILPLFGIWMLQREQIFFFIPFLFFFFYASHRYKFLDLGIQVSKILTCILALLVSYFCIFILRDYLSSLHDQISGFWGIQNSGYFSVFEFSLGVILFMILYKALKNKLTTSSDIHKFEKTIQNFKDKLPYLSNLETLNSFFNIEFKEDLKISQAKILYLGKNTNAFSELQKYFLGDISRDIFLNDSVFIEENKNKFDVRKIKKEIGDTFHLYIPIYTDGQTIAGFLGVGRKFFSDYFLAYEIFYLKSFSNSLGSHLKYIGVYKKLEYLSINLDKQVDEKTIEYNNLLSKQKEFIAYVGHEIKNPITNSIFLCDSLRDELGDMKDTKLSSRLKEDGAILYGELIKVSDLVKHIFSTEQFDLNKTKLYKKQENMMEFLDSEISIFRNTFSYISFTSNFGNLGSKKIDITQLRQVIHNLLTNATKFADRTHPEISIYAEKGENNKICISIEDNGNGFKEIEIPSIFDKYATGSGSAIGLGMGLYLCKKIVELHNGSIVAGNSANLGGAKFSITL